MRLQRRFMNQQSPSNGQRNGLCLSSHTTTTDRSPDIIFIKAIGTSQRPHRALPVMQTRENLQQALPVHQYFTFTLDQINKSRRSLSFSTAFGSTKRIQRWGDRISPVRVSRTNVSLHGKSHVLRDHGRVDLVEPLQDSKQPLVSLRGYIFGNKITELRQPEPGFSWGFVGGQDREVGKTG